MPRYQGEEEVDFPDSPVDSGAQAGIIPLEGRCLPAYAREGLRTLGPEAQKWWRCALGTGDKVQAVAYLTANV